MSLGYGAIFIAHTLGQVCRLDTDEAEMMFGVIYINSEVSLDPDGSTRCLTHIPELVRHAHQGFLRIPMRCISLCI